MPRLIFFVVVSLTALAGCSSLEDFLRNKVPNPDSCDLASNVGKPGCPDAGVVGGPCKNSEACPLDEFPVCDPDRENGTCVECKGADAARCTGTKPICSADDRCTGCKLHTDCPESLACLPDGSCALSTAVAYVDGDAGTDNMDCTKAMPCTRLERAMAVSKSIVKVSGTVKTNASLNDVTGKTIVAELTAILKPVDGVTLEVRGNSSIDIYDLQISKTGDSLSAVTLANTATLKLTRVTVKDSPGNGITVSGGQLTCTQCSVLNNTGRGIDASDGSITVTRSTISDNASGGIRATAKAAFHIVSNFVFHNGKAGDAGTYGISIQINQQPVGAPANELDFNSVSRNQSVSNGQGILCESSTPLTATSNIVWNNGLPISMQVSANGCTFTYSDIGPTGIVPIGSNINVDPGFVDEAAGDLHLTKGSPATVLRGAQPDANLAGLAAKDFDGNNRTNPSDIGAHQLPRQ